MLRGQGTLQALLGRSRVKSNNNNKRKSSGQEDTNGDGNGPSKRLAAAPSSKASQPVVRKPPRPRAQGSKQPQQQPPQQLPQRQATKQQRLSFSTTSARPTSAPPPPNPTPFATSLTQEFTTSLTSQQPQHVVAAEPITIAPLSHVFLPERAGWTRICTFIVGGRHRPQLDATQRALDERCVLQREPDNGRDRNAIQVVQVDTQGDPHVMGYVMADVARHLAPVLDSQQLTHEVHVHFSEQRTANSLPMTVFCQLCTPPALSPGAAPQPVPPATSPPPHGPPQPAPVTSAVVEGPATPPQRYREGETSQVRLDADEALSPSSRLHVLLERAVSANEAAMAARGEAAGRVLRDKFLVMVDELSTHDGFLFDDAERALMRQSRQLSDAAQCLFLRLHTRRGPWFQIATLDYPEVPDVLQAVAELVENSFASWPCRNDISALLDLLSADETRQLALTCQAAAAAAAATKSAATATTSGGSRGFSGGGGGGSSSRDARAGVAPRSNGTKADALRVLRASLQAGGATAAVVKAEILSLLGACVRVSLEAGQLMRRMQRVYFLVESQDVSHFLATHVGAIRYPKYTISPRHEAGGSRRHDAFDSREELLAYEQALWHATDLEDSLQADDWSRAADALAPAWEAIRSGVHMRVRWDDADGMAVPNTNTTTAHATVIVPPAPGVPPPVVTFPPVAVPTTSASGTLGMSDWTAGASHGDAGPSPSQAGGSPPCVNAEGRSQDREVIDMSLDDDAWEAGPPAAATQETEGQHHDHHPHYLTDHVGVAINTGEVVPFVAPTGTGDEQRRHHQQQHDLAHPVGDAVARATSNDVITRCASGTPGSCGGGGSASAASCLSCGVSGGWDGDGAAASDAVCVLNTFSGCEEDGGCCVEDDEYNQRMCVPFPISCQFDQSDQLIQSIPSSPAVNSSAADGLDDPPAPTAGSPATGVASAVPPTVPPAVQPAGPYTSDAAMGDGDDCVEVSTGAPPRQLAAGSNQQHLHTATGAPANRAQTALVRQKPLYLARYCSAWVYADMATVGVSMLERQKHHEEAVELLALLLAGSCCPSRRGYWWQRLSIDREHIGDVEGALQACEQGLADLWVRNGDRIALQRRWLRLGKPPRRWKRPTWAQTAMAEPPEVAITARMVPNNVTGMKSQFHSLEPPKVGAGNAGGDGPALVSVEEVSLQHYARPEAGGWTGVHTEGGVWATLFGLLMWDVMFDCSPPGVFRSPFQIAPLDLDTDAFYPTRKHQIDARLSEVASGAAPELLSAVWQAHQGTWCRGVAWDSWTLDTLQQICRCVGGLGLSVVLRLLAEDHRGWQGGMPDLLLWRPQQGDAMMVEVKGPRDRLSDQQRAWLLAVRAVDVRAFVLRVNASKK